MTVEQRQHRRFEKPLTIHYCVADVYPKEWDMSVTRNISAGGVRFTALSAERLVAQKIQLQIKLPLLAPELLKVEALVLDATSRLNNKIADVRAQFINLSETTKERLSMVDRMVTAAEVKRV